MDLDGKAAIPVSLVTECQAVEHGKALQHLGAVGQLQLADQLARGDDGLGVDAADRRALGELVVLAHEEIQADAGLCAHTWRRESRRIKE